MSPPDLVAKPSSRFGDELGPITETDFRTTSPLEVSVRILREFFEPAERT